jgi:hypothetical protein
MPPISSFGAVDVAIVDSAERTRVVSALTGTLPLTNSDRWFPRGNGYIPSASKRIEADGRTIPQSRTNNFLRYLAGGAFTHCGDAWSFIGRSLNALLQGDLVTSVHLLYYAELRSALSLLAGEGIFVGNNAHFVVRRHDLKEIGGKKGTHTVAWQALEAWADGSRSQALIGDVIRPGGETLATWVSSLTSRAAQAKLDALFHLMSLDLREFDQDHERRNTVSYNPARLKPSDMPAIEIRDLVTDVWLALEPSFANAFPVLDESLLPELLRSLFNAVKRPAGSWSSWLESIVPASLQGSALLSALQISGNTSGTSGLAGGLFTSRPNDTNPVSFLRPMMARTVLLLRIATGSSILLLRDSGHPPSAIAPWLQSLAAARGLWSPGSALDDPNDLWADVELALEEAEIARVGSLHELLADIPTGLHTLSQTERVPVWSFA